MPQDGVMTEQVTVTTTLSDEQIKQRLAELNQQRPGSHEVLAKHLKGPDAVNEDSVSLLAGVLNLWGFADLANPATIKQMAHCYAT